MSRSYSLVEVHEDALLDGVDEESSEVLDNREEGVHRGVEHRVHHARRAALQQVGRARDALPHRPSPGACDPSTVTR